MGAARRPASARTSLEVSGRNPSPPKLFPTTSTEGKRHQHATFDPAPSGDDIGDSSIATKHAVGTPFAREPTRRTKIRRGKELDSWPTSVVRTRVSATRRLPVVQRTLSGAEVQDQPMRQQPYRRFQQESVTEHGRLRAKHRLKRAHQTPAGPSSLLLCESPLVETELLMPPRQCVEPTASETCRSAHLTTT